MSLLGDDSLGNKEKLRRTFYLQERAFTLVRVHQVYKQVSKCKGIMIFNSDRCYLNEWYALSNIALRLFESDAILEISAYIMSVSNRVYLIDKQNRLKLLNRQERARRKRSKVQASFNETKSS